MTDKPLAKAGGFLIELWYKEIATLVLKTSCII